MAWTLLSLRHDEKREAMVGGMARRMTTRAIAGVLAALLASATPAGASPILTAKTKAGMVAGTTEAGLAAYKGIPFAEAPIGPLRWKPPLPARRWTGVKSATVLPPGCMQLPSPMMSVPGQPVSEDCLYLNIWTPAKSGRDRLPVLVWIHGGAFTYGSTAMPLFDGANLARKGVVVVSVAYRLGPLGFLAHPELTAESPDHVSGNFGLLDQIAALRWTQANIGAFGGDARRVTIMGESAGGVSVAMLAQSPLARGLFAGVIAESGAAFTLPDGMAATLPEAEATGKAWTAAAGAMSLGQLRAMPADRLLQAAPPTGAFTSLASSWPVRDGHVLPLDPAEAYRKGRFNDTPILIGSNDDEGSLFNEVRTRDAYLASLDRRYGSDAAAILGAYPAADDAEATRSAAALLGESSFMLPQLNWSRFQSRHGKGPVYFYHFAHDPPARPGAFAGPVHGAELPYVFDNLGVRKIAWSAADRRLAELMSSYWTNFAKAGDPNGPGLPRWPAFSNAHPAVVWFRDGAPVVGMIARRARLEQLDAIVGKKGARP